MEKLYGLIGEKLGHTLSPFIHNEIMKYAGINGHYGVMEVKRSHLSSVVSGLKALNFAGVNVTIPYKTDLIEYLDDLSAEAKKIGAVNVICISDDKAVGYNTDYFGFGMMLDDAGICVKGENALVLGTGGASKAVVQYLADAGSSEITLVTRNKEEAALKYPDCNIAEYGDVHKIKNRHIIVNCTPVGMFPDTDRSPLYKNLLSNCNAVVDLIYNPDKTKLMSYAEELGIKAVNGLYMLTAQAVKSQEIWNQATFPACLISEIADMLRIIK